MLGAGTVAAGGIITLIKTIPTIISSFKGSVGSLKNSGGEATQTQDRTERDLSIKIVGFGSLGLILLMTVNPGFGGQSFIASQLGKIARIRSMITRSGRAIHLEVDGGVDRTNAARIIAGPPMSIFSMQVS